MSKVSYIVVNIGKQRLYCMDDNENIVAEYPVSTSRFGVGSENGSFRTPLGLHSIAEKIGNECPENEVFIGRQPQGILQQLIADGRELPEDIITSRILRLAGCEPGINQGEGIDSYQRYIYIHGTSEEDKIGQAASHGCIRMNNRDVIELFDNVVVDCRVNIQE